MTQKGNLFKGKQKKKVIAPNRHGKAVQIRKGKRVVKPSKITRDMDTDRALCLELRPFHSDGIVVMGIT
ncbi:hypothetical protein Patl1_17102 [Pistacia atlantica]|uniref:Uncharacterized protein n=1 Tax=Pistacia atlantica TaxID=434234 RepID=A0ACC1B978_9ROSI|nr:hypothetical protein Patl1_17102 [Pistacia atlantica]